MSEHRTTNSILTAAVVAVYLGLVLAGATPQFVARSEKPAQSVRFVQKRVVRDGSQANAVSDLFAAKADIQTTGLSKSAKGNGEVRDLRSPVQISLELATADLTSDRIATDVFADLVPSTPRTVLDRIQNADLSAISTEIASRSIPLPRSDTSA
ncbi:MAG: hypothetical protein DYH05_08370 [Acidobacteria bacterium ACB1]|nr:hypothetical protein [Acidobacteria bacterium ACB1]RIJ95802.1 MAG: hypothetical protein DCC44_01510 [Acidobacteriota bacterium]